MTQKTRWSILEIGGDDLCLKIVQSIPSLRDCHPAAHDLGDRAEGKLKARRLQPDSQRMRISVPSSFPL